MGACDAPTNCTGFVRVVTRLIPTPRAWTRQRTQFTELCCRGLDHERARRSAWNARAPWWNPGPSHMNHAMPTSELRGLGLISLPEEHRRLVCSL